MNKIPFTPEGYKKFKKKLKYLKNVKRNEIIKSISEARKLGDLKENSEYHSAKEQQNFYERKIYKLENILLNSQIIYKNNINNKNFVIFGSTVSIKNIFNNKIKTYKIVGDYESNFKKKLISVNSPISRGIIGKKKNDIVKIKTPGGIVKYKIINIKYI